MIMIPGERLPSLFGPLTVELAPFGATQINDLSGLLETMGVGECGWVAVTAEVVPETGALIAYLCEVDNTTNAPTYQEAFAAGKSL